jgi:beta-lactamase regulating signal transducer with metallopeptidase domain
MHGLTQSALLKAMGWSLFNSLWQMSLLWAVYHLFILVFREAPARTRHGLAVLLVTAGAGWTALTFITTYWFGPATMDYLPATLFPGLLSAGQWFLNEGLSYFSFIYLLVLCGLLVHYTNHFLRSRNILRKGLSKISPEFRVFVATTARNMGILPTVRVHLSSLVDVPVTLGFLKPLILLPVAMITHLSPQQVEAILVHELAHIRRKDYLINLGVTVIEGVFFFNPFARMLIGQLKKEMEHCCDDLVLQFCYEPHAYVSALLSLARQHRHGRLAVAAIGGGGNRLLLQRARKILQQKRMDERPGARSLLLLFLTTTVAVLLLGISRPVQTARPAGVNLAETPPGLARPVAAVKELNTRPIINIVPQNVRRRPGHAIALRTVPSHTPHRATTLLSDAPAENDAALFNTAGTATTPAPAYADLVVIDNRDYSIGATVNKDAAPKAAASSRNEGFPFVPPSSFSFQYTDTIPPEDRLAMMQVLTEKTIRVQMRRLETELKTQLEMLRRAQSALYNASAKKNHAAPAAREAQSVSQQRLKQLLQQQLQLQQQYLKKLDDLQHQLQRAARRLTTVYI